MASLTPLSKSLISLAVVGGMASAVWHLALKDRFAAPPQPAAQTPSSTPLPQPTALSPPSPAAADNAEQARQLLERGDFAQARIRLEQAVNDGDGAAACHLGEMTLKGQGGIAANQEQAAKLFQLAQSRNVICFASGK